MAGATNIERSISVTAFVDPSDDSAAPASSTRIADLLQLPGFDADPGRRAGGVRAGADGRRGVRHRRPSRVVFRDRVCEHITIVSGRCLAGPLEVVIGEDTARRAGLRAGDVDGRAGGPLRRRAGA